MAKITRTSAGLRDALFDGIERLATGDIDGQQAQAMATLSKEICNTVRLEIEVARLRTEYPADSPIVVPKPLKLGLDDDKSPDVPKVPAPLRRIANADDVPIAPDGRVELCHICQRAAWGMGSFTELLINDLYHKAKDQCRIDKSPHQFRRARPGRRRWK